NYTKSKQDDRCRIVRYRAVNPKSHPNRADAQSMSTPGQSRQSPRVTRACAARIRMRGDFSEGRSLQLTRPQNLFRRKPVRPHELRRTPKNPAEFRKQIVRSHALV